MEAGKPPPSLKETIGLRICGPERRVSIAS